MSRLPGICVLHVDDESEFADLTAEMLERESDQITVATATSASEGLELLADNEFDCIVSDYDMPKMNGIEFLGTVRESHPDLPFILFTGKGSEEVASDAISAGVTDYLQKESGTDQYAVLANRIANAVAQTRAEQNLQEQRRRFQILFERLTQPTVEVEYEDDEPIVQQVNPAFEDVFGYDAADIVGNSLDEYIVPEDKTEETSQINQRVQAGAHLDSIEVTRRTADGQREFLLQTAVYDDGSGGFVIYTDITEQKRREQRFQAQRQQLEDLHSATRELLAAEGHDEIAARASGTTRDVLDLPLNGVYQYDPGRDALVPVVVTDAVQDVLGEPPVIGPGDGVAWTAYETGQPQVYGDIREAPDVMNPDTPIRSECLIPIGDHGVLLAGSTTPDAFTETDITSAKILAAHLEVAFDRADRDQRQQDHRAALRALHETTQTFMTAADQQRVASHAVETARTVLDQPINCIWLYNDETGSLEPTAWTEKTRELIDTIPTYTGDESLSWEAFQTGEMQVYDTLETEPDRYNPDTPLASEIVLPLGDYGVMNLGASKSRAFDEIDISLARIFGDIVETALARAEREQELARSRDLLRHTEELAQTGGWEVDAETRHLRWTQGTYAIHDLSADSAFDPTIDKAIDFYHPADCPRIRQVVERCLETGESFDEELRLITAEDRHRWVRATGEAITEDGSVRIIRGAIQDITDRKEQQQELERKNARLSALFEQFPEPTLAYAYEDGEPYISQVNEAFTKTFGHDAEEAVGAHVDTLLVPADRQDEAAQIDERVKAGDTIDQHLRRQTATGIRDFRFRNIPLADDDTIDGYAIYADITERKERERELDYQKSLFEATIETSLDAIHVVDEDRDIVTYNEQFVDMWEIPDEVLADRSSERALKSVLDMVEDPDAFVAQIDYLYDHPDEDSRDRVRLTDGRVLDRYSAPVTENGTYYGRVWIYRDITDLVEQTEQLERHNARLEEFVSIISHDLRNPLNVASARVELASDECESTHLARAEDALDRMDTLIEDLLTLAQEGKQVGETRPVELAHASEDCWQHVMTGEATLVTDTDQTIRADPSRMRELLENLVRNAVEHGGDDVTVTIGDLDNGFYVADDGPGIPEDERSDVFDSGYSSADGGTGFGLAIVEEIAEAHGWNIRLTDSTDGGAQFEITGVEFAAE